MKQLIIITFLFLFSCEKEPELNWTERDRDFLVNNLRVSYSDLLSEVFQMTDAQWNFQENITRWSTAWVVEHLEIHEALYHRELQTATALPEPNITASEMNDPDSLILSYQFITKNNAGPAPWYLEPKGRWNSKKLVIESYQKLRDSMIDFIEQTDKNLRAYATSSGRGSKKYRDLHQMILISIAHTRRHTEQIRKIKLHVDYPI